MSVNLTDNSDEVAKTFEEAVKRGLSAIGMEAEGYAKKSVPVDTGRLRNSITYVTNTAQGKPNTSGGEKAKPKDYAVLVKPKLHEVYIGTNVEYAQAVEYKEKAEHTTGGAHFLRDAATQHNEHYKKIMEASLKAN